MTGQSAFWTCLNETLLKRLFISISNILFNDVFRIESSEDVLEEFREMGRVSAGDEDIEREIFDKSKTPGGNFLDRQRFIRVIRRTGLQLDDPRLYDVR